MLRFVVALEAEARPIVERFRLRPDPELSAFRVYRGAPSVAAVSPGDVSPGDVSPGDVSLIVSGIGKVAAAAATSTLHFACGARRHAVWLNVGIAGHASKPAGEAVLAGKVTDHATGRSWYPPQVMAPPCHLDQVLSVDRPEREFAWPGAYDMEAAGFYPTACRFASAELVQCLKVVSDGPGSDVETLTADHVGRLIAEHLPTVEAVAKACSALARELRATEADPPELASCLERWRFTVTERRELRRQLRRRQTLAPEHDLPLDDVGERSRGKVVNRRLRDWLDGLAVG